jgi:O-antigen ligase
VPDPIPLSELTRRQRPLERLRTQNRSTPLHSLEKFLVILLALQLVFLPWALGGMHLWARLVSLTLASAAFITALWPRSYTEEFKEDEAFRLHMWPKLLRFPVFWLGLAFFAYVATQMYNPAWTLVRNAKGFWWLERVAFSQALPHGVANVPTELSPPWMALLPVIAAFLSVCAAWVGLTRRKAIISLLTVLSINATALAGFGIVQKLIGNGLIFWFYKSSNDSFISSFIYRNHASAYFNLAITLCAALASYHFIRTERQMLKSAPSGVFLVMAITIGAAVLVSYSRAGTILLLSYMLLLILIFGFQRLTSERTGRDTVVMLSLLAVLLCFVGVGVRSLNLGEAWERSQALLRGDDPYSVEVRNSLANMTWKMAADEPWMGHGLGAYRFIFPSYQQRDPLLMGGNDGGRHVLWYYAHNDYAQAAAELGILGLIPLAGILFYWFAVLARSGVWRYPPIWVLLLGLLVTLCHSWVDFQAHNPANLVTWCLLWACAVRWCELEDR